MGYERIVKYFKYDKVSIAVTLCKFLVEVSIVVILCGILSFYLKSWMKNSLI
jgi:hypothetical protein